MKEVTFEGGATVSFDGEANLGFCFELQQHITALLIFIDFLFNFLFVICRFDWMSDAVIQTLNVITFFVILFLNYTLLNFVRRINFIKRRWPNGCL